MGPMSGRNIHFFPSLKISRSRWIDATRPATFSERCATAFGLSFLMLFLSGCATHRSPISSPSGDLQPTNAFAPLFHAAGLAPASEPAKYSFQKAKGKLGSAKQGFSDAIEVAVSGPAAGIIVPGEIVGHLTKSANSEGEVIMGAAVAGIAGGVAVVGSAVVSSALAADGLVRSWRRLSPAELAEREATLEKALSEMASQERFREFVLKAAAEKSPGRLISIGPDIRVGNRSPALDAVLDARVEELRLERSGSDEGSYFLRITTRARLVRTSDSVVLYEQPVEYRSGHSLFLNWTLYGAVQSVAETGYRALAQYFVDTLFR